jgi:3-deoxy-D-manno-octulosonic acid kinase
MDQQTECARCYILQGENAINNLEAHHFDPTYWQDKPGFSRIDGGRGGSVKILIDGQIAMLRRYLRGGFVSRFLSDQYLWLGKRNTRPWREWSILKLAKKAGLPVPEPLGIYAARCGLYYRAVLMTDYFEGTETLAESLLQNSLPRESWLQLGKTLKRFHVEGIRHADLNANNILMDNQGQFFVIDFDRARMMKSLGDWQWRPLYRLQRSLEKINRSSRLHFGDDDWQALMDGYQASTDSRLG